MAALDDLGLALLADMHGDALHGALDPLHARAGMKHDAWLRQALDDDAARLRILVGEEGGGIDDGDMGAEHAVGLGDLHADRAAAEHDQMLDPLVHVEDRLVGEIGHLVEAGDRRDRPARSRWPRRSGGRGSDSARPRPWSCRGSSRCAWMTRTPRPVKRSTESFGAIAAMTPCT